MPKSKKVTSKAVAEAAGVSQTTVSFVLNNVTKANISEATKQRVWKAARKLGYVPDATARALVQGRSNNIGVILIRPHAQVFTDPYVPNIITGISAITAGTPFRLLVENIDNVGEIGIIDQMLRGGEIAGAIISGYPGLSEDMLLALKRDDYPIISLDPLVHDEIDYICINHFAGIRELANYFADLGHRDIACVGYTSLPDLSVENRLAVFRDELRKHGIDIKESHILFADYEPQSGYDLAQALLQLHPLPTAVWAMNDKIALGLMAALYDAGIRIPEDISIAGYDNMEFAPFLAPPLTTIDTPEIELGRHAVSLIINRINNEEVTNNGMRLVSSLVIRRSCAAKQ